MTLDFEGYIFDCDGTLTDSMPLHAVAWEETMKRYGISFPRERCYSMGGMPTVKIIEILAEENGKSLNAAKVAKEKEEEFFRFMDQLGPIPEVMEMVQACIKAEKKMSVASGSARHSVDLQLKQIGLDGVFEIIVAAEDTERHKPEPDVFLRAAELMHVEPKNCVVYEDADLGIQAAKCAGMAWVDVRELVAQRSSS
jgi:beta-phosphoglucomutase family hydrolase